MKPISRITAAAKAGIKRFSRFHAALAATRENTVKGVETASEASEASDICPTIYIYEVLVVVVMHKRNLFALKSQGQV